MNLLLADGVRVDVVAGRQLPYRPELLLDGMIVSAGPYSDRAEHEAHVVATRGSVDWFALEHVEELRFSGDSGVLCSLALHVPDRLTADAEYARQWLEIPPQEGVLRLCDAREFRIPATGMRWQDPHGSTLLCHYAQRPLPGSGRTRLRVTRGLDLLFESGSLAGWLLDQPARYLSNGSGRHAEPVDDKALTACLASYLAIVAYPLVDDLIDGDPAVQKSLEQISARISTNEGDAVRRAVLREAVNSLVREWYE